MSEEAPPGILRLDMGKPRRSSGASVEFRSHPDVVEPISPDRLSVSFAPPSSTTPQTDHSTPRSTPSMDKVQFHTDDDDDEDYSASACVIMQRRQSSRRKSRRHQGGRRPSSPLFSPDFDSGHSGSRRRSSVFTTSSGDTAVSMGMEEVTQEQIYENLRLHKEVLSNVKHQPWSIQRKLRLVRQAKAYVKQHEGELQQRLAQGKTTKDVLARFDIILVKRWQYLKRELANFMNLLIPWELRIKEIESHFGSVVASYFTFLRWLFWVNLVIAILLIAFVAIPEVLTADPRKAGERKEMLPEEREKATNLATLWDFEGVLRYSPFFYGYYTNQDTHGTGYRLPFAYFMTGLAVYIYSFVAILRRMAKNSRMSKLSEKEDECVFTWKLFTGWDYMIGNAETAHNRVASIILGFKEALVEEAEKKKDARNWQIIGLRVLVNVTVLALLASSAYAVVEVVKRSTHVEHDGNWWRQNEITIVLTSITFIFPIIFEVLGFFECFHPRKQLRLQLARIMVLNMLNLYTLIFALFGKISFMTTELENWKPNTTTTLSPVTEAQQSRWSPTTQEQMHTMAILTMIATSIESTPKVTKNILTTVRDSSTADTTMPVLVNEQAVNKFSTVAISNIHNVSENSSLPLPTSQHFESSSLSTTETSSTEHSEEPEGETVSSSMKYDLTSSTASTAFEYDDSQQYIEEWEHEQKKVRDKRDIESVTIGGTNESEYDSLDVESTVIEISTWNNENEESSPLSSTTVETTHSELKSPSLETDTEYLESFSSQSAVFESQSSTQESIPDTSTLSDDTEQQFQPVTEHTEMLTTDNSDLNETQPFSILWQPTLTSTVHITGETLSTTTQPTGPTSELFPADQMDPKNRIKLRRLCWETMFGQELVKLTVMDLVVTVTSTLIMDFIRALFVRFANGCWCWDLEKQFPQYGDFKIAENILHLVNNQGMVWMGMFFSPGLPLLNLVKLIVLMYLRSWAVLTCNVPHEVVFRASRSNNFYFALLLTMLFLCVLPVGYTIVWIKPSWHCGPFSNYQRIYHIFTKSLQKALPTSLHRALDYIASPGTVIPLLLLLILVIYYLLSLTGALREANNDLKIQLRRERTEERRKMFQLVHRRRRGGSGADSSDMPINRWRSILSSVPSKTENTTLGNGNVKNEANRNELLSKIVKKALRKSSATSDEESLPIVEGIEHQDLTQEKLKANKAKSRAQESIQEIPNVSVHHHNKRQRHKSSSNSSNNREREDSITSAWSEKIPEIRISKTDSTEYIQQQAEPQCPVKTSGKDASIKAEEIEPVHMPVKPATTTHISGVHISSDETQDKKTLAKNLMTDCSVRNANVDSHELVHLRREKTNDKEENPKQTSVS